MTRTSHGWRMQMVTKTERQRQTPLMTKTRKVGIYKSSMVMSLESRAMMRPVGLESKKSTGERAICLIMAPCMLSAEV
jgi:hypothetical protein